jgi:hypothetical protein
MSVSTVNRQLAFHSVVGFYPQSYYPQKNSSQNSTCESGGAENKESDAPEASTCRRWQVSEVSTVSTVLPIFIYSGSGGTAAKFKTR